MQLSCHQMRLPRSNRGLALLVVAVSLVSLAMFAFTLVVTATQRALGQ